MPEILPGVLGDSAMENIKDIAKDFDVVLMGPGLGRNDETCQMVRKLAIDLDKPLVLDADAIFAFSQAPDELKKNKTNANTYTSFGRNGKPIAYHYFRFKR